MEGSALVGTALSKFHRIFHGFLPRFSGPRGHPFVSSRQAHGVTDSHGSARARCVWSAGSSTGVRDINERGDISASIRTECGSTFLLRDRIFETIDFPGSVNDGGTLVMDDNGFLVGGFIDAKGSEHGFIAR